MPGQAFVSGLIICILPLARCPLDFQDGEEVQVFTDDPGVVAAMVEIVPGVDQAVGAHGLEAEHDIVGIQGHEVHVVQPLPDQGRPGCPVSLCPGGG